MSTKRYQGKGRGGKAGKKISSEPLKPLVLQPHIRVTGSLGPNVSKLGEFASLCLFGPVGNIQYTVCRPIGYTDLDADDWTMISTDQVPAALARIKDPRAGEAKRKAGIYRSESLVTAALLLNQGKDGMMVLHYPSDSVTSRNEYLSMADGAQKAKYGELRAMQAAFTKDTPKTEVEACNHELSKVGNLLTFIDEKVRSDEVRVRKHVGSEVVKKGEAKASATSYRTLIGPFGDQPQSALLNAKGKPLADVVASIHKTLLGSLLQVGESTLSK